MGLNLNKVMIAGNLQGGLRYDVKADAVAARREAGSIYHQSFTRSF